MLYNIYYIICYFILYYIIYYTCCFYSIQSAQGLLRMDSNTTLNPGNRLRITWVNLAYQIKDRYLPSMHF